MWTVDRLLPLPVTLIGTYWRSLSLMRNLTVIAVASERVNTDNNE